MLLAAIVEIASGETYDRFIAREVFRPAGLRRVAFVGACPKGIARTVAPGLEGSPCALPPILARRGPTGAVANVDDLLGGPVAGAAEHNRFVAALVEMLREGRTTDIDAALGVKHGDSVRRWWSRLAPRSAAVLGTAPALWSEEGGTATFLRIEQSNGNRIARVEWSDDGKFRALGGAAIPAPLVLLVRGEEAFDPANGSIVRISR